MLNGVFGKQVLLTTGETVSVDDAYLRESIVSPVAKVVAGYQPVMPTFQGQLSEEQLIALVAYLRSLPPADRPAADVPPAAVKAGKTGSR